MNYFNIRFLFPIEIYTILLINLLLFKYSSQSDIENRRYPKAKLLPTGDFFVILDNGIYLYNFNFVLTLLIFI